MEGAEQSREASHGPDECIDYGPSCRVCAEQGEKRALQQRKRGGARSVAADGGFVTWSQKMRSAISTRFSPIWAERASLEIADRIIDKVTDRFWLLGEHPDEGKASDGIAAGVKCFPAGKYLIYYRATRRGTDILHVFHGARDQRKALKKARETR